jgi:DNA processing protein
MDEPDRSTDHSSLLALLRAPATPRVLYRLVSSFGSCAAVIAAGRDVLVSAGAGPALLAYMQKPDWRGVELDLRWLQQTDSAIVALDSPGYPELLRGIPDPPLGLFIRGEVAAAGFLQLAIIGSRTPTVDGRRLARKFAAEAVGSGLVVTSGMAIGIDGEAHAGAIAGGGRTIAVLGNGLARVYPRRHAALADKIAANGALVSEFPCDYPPLAENFPRRNRIMSGLSVGVLVVEAALRSGTLITADHALEQGREVFAVPGSIANSRARGCHALIRQGAKLVEDIGDVLEEIQPLVQRTARPAAAMPCAARRSDLLDGNSSLLLDNIGTDPVIIDSLVETTGLPVGMAVSLLSNLEIAGLIEFLPGGGYVRKQV